MIMNIILYNIIIFLIFIYNQDYKNYKIIINYYKITRRRLKWKKRVYFIRNPPGLSSLSQDFFI